MRAHQPPSALDIINQQCGEHHGEYLVRIRIHPSDWSGLSDDIRRAGFGAMTGLDKLQLLAAVPIVRDPTCLEGPICEWRPLADLVAAIRGLSR